jgi:branched-chain amino acid aminotransferase
MQIVPYGDLPMSPAMTSIHYGQSIFEGIKAYHEANGEVVIFRPDQNWHRMNHSAARMAMPEVPEELFMGGLQALLEVDKAWVPKGEGTSLYIRPFMFATDAFIGVKPAERFRFMIITSPSGPYYSKPVSIYVQRDFVRAFPGGTGSAKCAGNYGATMLPVVKVRELGYDQILWTDGVEHKYVQEIGTMNVWFVLGDTVVTPPLDGTILAGVTRNSVMQLLREKGVKVEERPITVQELEEAFKAGQLKEAFGTGTAASIAPISDCTIQDGARMELPPQSEWTVAPWVKSEMDAIRYGRKEDTHGWLYKV